MAKKRQNATAHQTTVIEESTTDGYRVVEEEVGDWTLETRRFEADTPPLTLTLTLGVTKNLGDYQSARMDLGISVPCLPDEVPEYYEKAKSWIQRKLGGEIRRIDDDFVDRGRLR